MTELQDLAGVSACCCRALTIGGYRGSRETEEFCSYLDGEDFLRRKDTFGGWLR